MSKINFVYSVYYALFLLICHPTIYSLKPKFNHIILEAQRQHLLLQAAVITLFNCNYLVEEYK